MALVRAHRHLSKSFPRTTSGSFTTTRRLLTSQHVLGSSSLVRFHSTSSPNTSNDHHGPHGTADKVSQKMLEMQAPPKLDCVGSAGVRRFPQFLDNWGRKAFYKTGAIMTTGVAAAFVINGFMSSIPYLIAAPVVTYWYIGFQDLCQNKQAVRKNFPVLGNFRYLLENMGPEIRQYFIEDDHSERPYTREQRAMVYRRSKPNTAHAMPFGTRLDVDAIGYEWFPHSMFPTRLDESSLRVQIGTEPECKQPYSASRLNVSGMSYGAINKRAVGALNAGARMGGFSQNTGEGGLTDHHFQMGGDIVWNVGTGYFGCRTLDGQFDPELFSKKARHPNVKMIELKLSQGAKPAHGGLLPKDKVTQEIADIRGVRVNEDCHSPPFHSAFEPTPTGLVFFIKKLRELSGGKPVGMKLCVGKPDELAGAVRAMVQEKIYPDFITVDGGEGGTGAAPVEFSNSVGAPLVEGLTLTHDLLVGAGIRDRVKIIASGKIVEGKSMMKAFALGADVCNAARAFMFSLGCIQALKCNSNKCPTGITTFDPELMQGLDVELKSKQVALFHRNSLSSLGDLVGAARLTSPSQLTRSHLYKRIAPNTIVTYEDLYPSAEPGSLLRGQGPAKLQKVWDEAGKYFAKA